jgi:hypothetical protein
VLFVWARGKKRDTNVVNSSLREQKMRRIVILALLMTALGAPAISEEYKVSIAQDELKKALEKYSSCQGGCALELSKMIFEGVPTTVVSGFGAMAAQEASIPDSIKVLTWVAFAQYLYNTGEKIVDDNKACYESCDALNSEIIRLGRAGLLGPMLRGDSIDLEALKDGAVFRAFLQFIKPIELPAEHRGKEWWDLVRSTA